MSESGDGFFRFIGWLILILFVLAAGTEAYKCRKILEKQAGKTYDEMFPKDSK